MLILSIDYYNIISHLKKKVCECYFFHHCFILEREPQPWWMVDLGSSQCVGTVNVFNRVDCCGKYLHVFVCLLLFLF